MSDEKPSTSVEVKTLQCIGVSQNKDGTYEVTVFTLQNSKVVGMEVISAADKAEAADAFKINAQRKIISPLVRGNLNG